MHRALSLCAATALAAFSAPVSATFTCIATYVTTTTTCTVCGTVACATASCVDTVSLNQQEYCRGVAHKGIFAQQYAMLGSVAGEAVSRLGTESPQAQVNRFASRSEWQTFSVCDARYGTCASNTAHQAQYCRQRQQNIFGMGMVGPSFGDPCWGGAIFYNDGQVAAAFIGAPMTSIRTALQSLHKFASTRGSLSDRVVRAGAAVAENGEGDVRCARNANKAHVSADSGMVYIRGCVSITIEVTSTAGYVCTGGWFCQNRPPSGTYRDAFLELQHRYFNDHQRPSNEPLLIGCVVTSCNCWGTPTHGTQGVHIPCPCPPVATPAPTPRPTPRPTVQPTAQPTATPTAVPTAVPTAEPTPEPTPCACGQTIDKGATYTDPVVQPTEHLAYCRCVADDGTQAVSICNSGQGDPQAVCQAGDGCNRGNGDPITECACKPDGIDGNTMTFAQCEEQCGRIDMRLPANSDDVQLAKNTGCGANAQEVWVGSCAVCPTTPTPTCGQSIAKGSTYSEPVAKATDHLAYCRCVADDGTQAASICNSGQGDPQAVCQAGDGCNRGNGDPITECACKPDGIDGNTMTFAQCEEQCGRIDMRLPANSDDVQLAKNTGCGANAQEVWVAGTSECPSGRDALPETQLETPSDNAEPETQSETEQDAQPETQAETEPVAQSPDTQASETQAETEPATQPDSPVAAQPSAQPSTQASETQAETEPATQPDSPVAAQPSAQPGTQAGAETESEPDTQPESEPAATSSANTSPEHCTSCATPSPQPACVFSFNFWFSFALNFADLFGCRRVLSPILRLRTSDFVILSLTPGTQRNAHNSGRARIQLIGDNIAENRAALKSANLEAEGITDLQEEGAAAASSSSSTVQSSSDSSSASGSTLWIAVAASVGALVLCGIIMAAVLVARRGRGMEPSSGSAPVKFEDVAISDLEGLTSEGAPEGLSGSASLMDIDDSDGLYGEL